MEGNKEGQSSAAEDSKRNAKITPQEVAQILDAMVKGEPILEGLTREEIYRPAAKNQSTHGLFSPIAEIIPPSMLEDVPSLSESEILS